MKASRIFGTIWRINAVLILCVGVLAAAASSVLVYRVIAIQPLTPTRDVHDAASTGGIRNQLSEIGNFEEIPGADGVLRAPLNTRQADSLDLYENKATSVQNYLFFDTSSRLAYWLKPSGEGVILETHLLPKKNPEQKQPDSQVVVYVTVEKDSSGDSRLTQADTKKIAVSDPKGKNYNVVIEKADRLLGARLLRPDKLLILYSLESKLAGIELNPLQPNSAIQAYAINTPGK